MARERVLKVTIVDEHKGSGLKSVAADAGKAESAVEKFGAKWGPRLAVGGAAAAAFGAKLTQMGDESKQATAQLTQAIENAGGSMDEFGPKIEKTSNRLIDLGHDDEAAARAMATLATATQDPTKAIESMGLVADIAAARHISLESAADKLAGAYAGKTKVFKEFGITLSANATAEERAAAMTELQARVQGQAAAQADNLTTKLTALRTRVENVAESVGSTLGPVLTVAGTAMSGLGGLSTMTGMKFGQMAATAGPVVVGFAAIAAGAAAVGYALKHQNDAATISAQGLTTLSRASTNELVRTFEEARVVLGRFGLDGKQIFRDLAETSYGAAQRTIEGLEAQANKTKEQQSTLAAYKTILGEVGAANVRAGEDAKVHATAEDDLTASMDKAKSAADGLKTSFDALSGKHIDAAKQSIAYESQLRTLTTTLAENGATLDRNTEAGEENELAMIGLIEKAQSLAQAQVIEGASVEAATAEFGRHVGQLRAVMLQAGFTEAQVDELITKYGQVPAMKKTAIIVTGTEAMQHALNIARNIFGLPSEKVVTTTYVSRYTSTGQVPGGPYVRYATGGPIRMAFAGPVPGTGSGDHVPVLAEPGEFMIRKSSAQKIGLPALTRMNAMASGGQVGGGTTGTSVLDGAPVVNLTFEPGAIVAHGVENIDDLADRIMVALQRKLRYRPDLGLS